MNYDERFSRVLDELRNKDYRHFKYVVARSESETISEALREAGIPHDWFYRQPASEREELNELAAELRNCTVVKAKTLLSEAAASAAELLISFMDTAPKNATELKLSFEAAKEVLDRAGAVKKTQYEVSGEIGHVFQPAPAVKAAIEKYWIEPGGVVNPHNVVEGEFAALPPGRGNGDTPTSAPALHTPNTPEDAGAGAGAGDHAGAGIKGGHTSSESGERSPEEGGEG